MLFPNNNYVQIPIAYRNKYAVTQIMQQTLISCPLIRWYECKFFFSTSVVKANMIPLKK